MGKNNTNLPDVFEICLLEIVQNDLHFTQIFFGGFFRILLREIPMYLHCSRPSVALFYGPILDSEVQDIKVPCLSV